MTSLYRSAGLPSYLKTLAVAAVLAVAPAAAYAQDSSASSEQPSQEQPAISPDTIVATVGGEPITEADLAFTAEELGANINQIPPEQLRSVLVAQMISLKLFAQAAEAAGLNDDPTVKMHIDYLAETALRRAFAQTKISEAITPDEIKAEYDKQIAAIPNEDEIHARHILVSTEEDAKAIKAELDAGADFAELAKTKSIEPNAAQSGGDLGYFKQGVMVKPFADAAFAMEVGQVSEPVQTQFGWHIIKVEDRRPAAKPTLEELTPQISQQLQLTKYRQLFNDLRKSTTVEIPDATLAEQVNVQLGPVE